MNREEKIDLIAKTMYGNGTMSCTWEELVARADRWRDQNPKYYFVHDIRMVDEYRKQARKILKQIERP